MRQGVLGEAVTVLVGVGGMEKLYLMNPLKEKYVTCPGKIWIFTRLYIPSKIMLS
jgi:hypothetical protein